MAFISGQKPREERLLQVGSNKFELVDFRLYERDPGADPRSEPTYEGVYGINIAKVREINKISRFTKLPNAHECVEGVLELRDEAIPVVNLARFLGYRNAEPRSTDNIIICEFNQFVTGFIVHEATRIRRISWEQILPPTRLTGKEGGSVTGMYKLEGDKMLLILDFERIVAEINGDTLVLDRFEQERTRGVPGVPVPHLSARTVLIVDDSHTGRAQTEMILCQSGFEVVSANDGEEALELLERVQALATGENREIYDYIQLIVSDVEMPRMDGYAFAQRVKNDPRFAMLPIVMNTSLSGRNNMVQAKSFADDYVVKFNPEELTKAVERLMVDLHGKRTKKAALGNRSPES